MTTLKPIHQERTPAEMKFDQFIERMVASQQHRHAWLYAAGEQIRRWREEDKALSNTVKGK